jgi:tetratricopeptide (TPR) repeat protein
MTRHGRLVLTCVTGWALACGGSGGGKSTNGDDLRAHGDLSGAYQAYQRDVQKHPDSAEAYTDLGEVLVDLKRFDEAATALEHAQQLKQSNRITVALAAARAGQRRFDEASAMMDEVLEDSRSADNLYRAAQIKLAQKKSRDALSLAEEAAKEDGKRLEIQGQVGRAKSQLGEHDDAIKILEGVLKQYKKQGAAAAEMEVAEAQSYIAVGRIEEGFHAYRHAAGVDPRNPDAQAGYAAMLRERGDIEGAISVLKAAESKSPKAAVVQYQLGLSYRDFKLREQAIAALQKAVQLDPGFADAYPPLIAMMDEDKVPTDKLYGTLEAAAARAPDDFDTQMRFGKLAESRRQNVKAMQAYERGVAAKPSDVDANFSLGRMQVANGKIDEAQQSYDALRTLDDAKAAELAQLIAKAPPPQVAKQTATAQVDGGERPDKPPTKPSKGKPAKAKAKAKGKKKGR